MDKTENAAADIRLLPAPQPFLYRQRLTSLCYMQQEDEPGVLKLSFAPSFGDPAIRIEIEGARPEALADFRVGEYVALSFRPSGAFLR